MTPIPLRKAAFIVSGCIILSNFCACLYIPTPHTVKDRPYTVHGEIDPSFIQAGITTKEDILLKLGKPIQNDLDDIYFSYEWITSMGVAPFVLLGYIGVAAAGVIYHDKSCWLRIVFDENDVVKECELTSSHEFSSPTH